MRKAIASMVAICRPPKDGHILISKTYKYVFLHGKGTLNLWLMLKIQRWDIIPDSLDQPNIIVRALKRGKPSPAVIMEGAVTMEVEENRWNIAALLMEEWGQEPRNVGNL